MAKRPRGSAIGAAFVAPAFCFIMLIVIYPLAYALWASFTNRRLTSPRFDFVGFDTYAAAFESDVFRDSLVVTAIFLLLAVAIEFALGLALALSFHRMRRQHPVMRSLLLLPLIVTPVTVGLI